MAATDIEEWLASANDTIALNLIHPVTKQPLSDTFNPVFTYFFLPDVENSESQDEDFQIFGYKDLEIDLTFRAHDLRPHISFSYSEKFSGIGETKALELDRLFAPYLPNIAFTQAPADTEDPSIAEWKPPGELLKQYQKNGSQYEIWRAKLADPRAREILRNMQILVPFFIEGGTCQDLDDEDWTMERWQLFLIYQTQPAAESSHTIYTLTGFCTTYRSWVFPSRAIQARLAGKPPPEEQSPTPPLTPRIVSPSEQELVDKEVEERCNVPFDPLQTPSRERISQFVVLPPYIGQGHGPQLYETITKGWLDDQYVCEFTVEDPNEAFDRLRDLADLKRLRATPEFAELTLADTVPDDALKPNAPVPIDLILPLDTVDVLRAKSKISTRQFSRLLEMQLLSKIPRHHCNKTRISRKAKSSDPNDRRYFFWRLVVKERLYRQHRDVLLQLDKEERVQKVEETVEGVQEEYMDIIDAAARRELEGEDAEATDSKAAANGGATGKRRRVVDDDEDESDGDTISSGDKKQRLT